MQFDTLSIGSMVIDYIQGLKCFGGAAVNVAINLARLGLRSSLFSNISHDQDGSDYKMVLEASNINISVSCPILSILPECQIEIEGGKTKSIRWLDHGLSLAFEKLRVDKNLVHSAKYIHLASCEQKFAQKIAHSSHRTQILSYSPGEWLSVSTDYFLDIQQMANFVFLNEREMQILISNGVVRQPGELIQESGKVVVLTRGSQPSLLFTEDSIHEISVDQYEQIVDETGAGDGFASAFIWAHSRSYPLTKCAQLASIFAGLITQHIGAQVPIATTDKFKALARERGLL
jgi:fructoselysine 6-kinase